MAERVAAAVEKEGGKTYYVGGCVRDLLLGRDSKDIDIEVHGIELKQLENILDHLGERISKGESFGVMGIRHYDVDIAMPRAETATGRGHKDFEISIDPFLGEEKAALRRDFTINALMQNVLSGEILDFYGGYRDLKEKKLRHVSEKHFPEDPLRVFRGAQFAARFGLTISEDTREICRKIPVDALAGERIMEELNKALLKAEKPSVFFEELRIMNQLDVWFPEVKALINLPQSAQYHPEGDVWNHTMQVVDQAAKLKDKAEKPLYLMLSALCHDFGKAVTTKEINGQLHAYNHEVNGLPLVEQFLTRITKEKKLIEYVLNMTRMHMEPNMKVASGSSVKSFMGMFNRSVCPEDLLLLARADFTGCREKNMQPTVMESKYVETQIILNNMLEIYQERMNAPYIMGRDLIEYGFRPGPLFSEALEYAHKLRLAGIPKEEQMSQVIGVMRKKTRMKSEN